MRICLDMRTGAGCGTENPNHAHHCSACGKPLRFALTLHDPKVEIGRYRVVRVIGYGAYGAVYEAIEGDERQTSPLARFFSRYTRNDGARCLLSNAQPDDSVRRVALKETFDASSISSFAREFRVLSGLEHANLPRYIDMFEVQGNGYLVMEYVPGQSLQEILDEQTELLPESQVLGYALQLCDVLEYLHSQQPPILHRDIKPANIRLTPEGRIKLVDFGLLKQAGYQTRATIRGLGTPAYAPLEQYGDNQQVTDVRSDIYSLGATLYHLLSGQEPPSAPDRITKTLDPLLPLSKCRPALSPHLTLAVMSAMKPLPQERYATITELKQSLLGISPTVRSRRVPKLATSQTKSAQVIETPRTRPKSGIQKLVGWLINIGEDNQPARPAWAPQLVAPRALIVEAVDEMSLPHTIWKNKWMIDLAYSFDGQRIATLGVAGKIYLWHLGDGRLMQSLTEPENRLSCMAISPHVKEGSGQTIAGGSSTNLVRIWRAADGQLLHVLRGHTAPIRSLAYSPDGHLLASGGGVEDGTVRLWRVADGQLLRILHVLFYVNSVAFSPRGQLIASGSGDSGRAIRLWQVTDGRLVRTTGKGNDATSLAWHPDGQMLVSGFAKFKFGALSKSPSTALAGKRWQTTSCLRRSYR